MKIMKKTKKLILFCIAVLAVGAAVFFLGRAVFPARADAFGFALIALCAVLILCAVFEGSRLSVLRISLISVMTALSVCGRAVFYAVPFFKPVSAVVILCGMYLGPVAGMICGAMSALLSGVFFGYGLWLPFQMLAWGMIGAFSGILRAPMKKSRLLLCAFGALSGVVFSAFMDIFTVLNFGNGFDVAMYAAAVVSALPVTAVYAVSNVIFLLALCRPVEKKLSRVLSAY